MQWKCKDCNYIKHFTRPVPREVPIAMPEVQRQCISKVLKALP